MGRRTEVALLDEALELAEHSPGIVALTGEPGIGKTRLVAELSRRARERGYLALTGRGEGAEHLVPFGILIDAIDSHLGSLDQEDLRSLIANETTSLAAIFPSVSSLAEESEHEAHDRRDLVRAVRALLSRLARQQSVVLALDDFHLADEQSARVVSDLLRRPPEEPILLALAFRTHHVAARIAHALERAVREGVAQRIDLSPLSDSEADELVGEAIDRATRAIVYRESGGNPFYLRELARAAHQGQPTAPHRGGEGAVGVPLPVADAIAAEISSLSKRALLVARAAAVAGDPFEADLIAAAADLDEASALQALDELLAFDIVRPAGHSRRFSFRRPIVARAVYESAPGGWLIAAHGRAARLLSARGASAPSLAPHVRRSAHTGDREAIALLTDAGRTTAEHDPRGAAEWFGAALELLPSGTENAEQRAGLHALLAAALASAGRLADSRDASREALTLLPGGPTRARAAAQAALVDHLLADHGEADRRSEEELSALSDQSSPEAAELQAMLVLGRFVAGDLEGMRGWATRALVPTLSPGALGADLTAALAVAQWSLGHPSEAEARTAEAVEIVDRLSDKELAERPLGSLWVALAETAGEHFESAAARLERCAAICGASGRRHVASAMLSVQAAALAWQGHLSLAARTADEGIELSRASGGRMFLGLATAVRSWPALGAGDIVAAIGLAEEAVLQSGNVTSALPSRVARCLLAEARLESGDPERCRDLLTSLGSDRGDSSALLVGLRPYEVLTRAELALGRREEADAVARRAEEAAAQLGLPGATALAQRARAAVALARGDAAQAAEAAIRSTALATEAGARIEAARSGIVAGAALATAGERHRAVAALREAEAELAACGASRYRDQAARELRRLGDRAPRGGRRRGSDSGVLGLTKRQFGIMELVAAGKTNRDIAAELFLSRSGVESHLTRIFGKLGVSSRAAAVSTFERARSDMRRGGRSDA